MGYKLIENIIFKLKNGDNDKCEKLSKFEEILALIDDDQMKIVPE